MDKRRLLVKQRAQRLSYKAKFVIVSCLFFIGLGALMYGMYLSTTGIYYAETELEGNVYQRPLQQLLIKASKSRLLTDQVIAGEETQKNDLLDLQSQMDQDFDHLIGIDKNLEESLETRDQNFHAKEMKNLKPSALKNTWNSLKGLTFKTDATTSRHLHDQLIADIRNLIVYTGDTSQLILDPDLDSYYIMDVTLIRLPDVLDTISQIQMFFTQVIRNKTLSAEDKGFLLAKISLIRDHISGTESDFVKVFETGKALNDPEAQQALEAPVKDFSQATREFVNQVEAIVNAKELPASSTSLVELGDHAIQSTQKLWDDSVEQLDRLLNKRKSALQRSVFIKMAIASLIALIGFLYGLRVMDQLTKPLNDIVETSDRLATGSLTARVTALTNDELGQLGRSFNKMAQSVQDLVGQLNKSVVQLTSYTTEITSAAKEQESTISEQEVTCKEITATAKGIYEVAKDLAQTMSGVNATAEETSELAAAGQEGLSQMSLIMQQMVDASSNIASKLAVLNEKAGNITGVITTITKVADQTNLLSLNAAIEAEKAGEYGRSFAVIAREIRRLADQTAYATLDIEKMVNEMSAAVSSGVMGVDKFSEEIRGGVNQVSVVSEQLSKIISQVRQQSSGIEKVNEGMQVQSHAAEQITDSIMQLNEATKQTSISLHQFQRAVDTLSASTKNLQASVETISGATNGRTE